MQLRPLLRSFSRFQFQTFSRPITSNISPLPKIQQYNTFPLPRPHTQTPDLPRPFKMSPALTVDPAIFTTGELIYAVPPTDGSKPFVNVNAGATGERDTNMDLNPVTVKINNIRTATTPIGLDITGFETRTIPSAFSADHSNFNSEDKIKADYYPEIEAAVLKATGAREVFIFDHTIRRRTPGTVDSDPSKRQPVARVHVDQTTQAAINRVTRHLGDRAEELLTRRFALINVWRPIENTASDHPLAVANYKSVKPKDLLATTLIYPPPLPNGETFSVAHDDAHEWYYNKDQTIDEVMFIKCFDSEALKEGSEIALLTPHTAFNDPATPEGSKLRQSIEVRVLVFY